MLTTVPGDLHALLTMVDRAKFRHVVRPGDRLELEARVLRVTEDGGQAQAEARCEGKLAAEAQLSFAFAVVTNPVVLAKRREFLNIWLTGSVSGWSESAVACADLILPSLAAVPVAAARLADSRWRSHVA